MYVSSSVFACVAPQYSPAATQSLLLPYLGPQFLYFALPATPAGPHEVAMDGFSLRVSFLPGTSSAS